MSYKKTLFVFRQDLRILDNTGFAEAVHDSESVIPVFLFDKRVLFYSPEKDKRLGFLIDALRDLDRQLRERGSRLYVFHGDSVSLTKELLEKYTCDALYHNRSYGEGSRQRDEELHEYCDKISVIYKNFDDFLLVEPADVKPMKVFTPFKKRRLTALKEKLNDEGLISQSHVSRDITTPDIDHDNESVFAEIDAGENTSRPIDGWKDRLENFSFDQYDETRNTPSIDGSSRLSSYHRHGLLSIRELYNHIKTKLIQNHHASNDYASLEVYMSEIAWREFWIHITHNFPFALHSEFQEKRRHIKREQNESWLNAWKEGKTGYPLVDAGMRQLKEENRMHNRVRMVVASFLCKDMLIDWREGDAHFRRRLLDYGVSIDIGNWQWAASVGADPKPLRIFNPTLQSQRFDKQALYIKKRIPELADASVKEILDPFTYDLTKYGYPSPVVDHDIMRKEAKRRYDDAKEEYEKSRNENEN